MEIAIVIAVVIGVIVLFLRRGSGGGSTYRTTGSSYPRRNRYRGRYSSRSGISRPSSSRSSRPSRTRARTGKTRTSARGKGRR